MKYVIIGDIHFSPSISSRSDDIIQTLLRKLSAVYSFADDVNAKAVITTGDTFSSAALSPASAQNNMLITLMKFFDVQKIPMYAILGNHDLLNKNIQTLQTTSVYLLNLLTKKFNILRQPMILHKNKYTLHPVHYEMGIDTNYSRYADFTDKDIVIAHSMLIDHKMQFSDFVDINKVETNAKAIISGHYHGSFGPTVVNNTIYVNPGALLRTAIDQKDRIVKAMVLDTNSDTLFTDTLLLPTEPVFYVAEHEQKKEAEKYAQLLRSVKGVAVTENSLQDAVKTIGMDAGFSKEVIKKTLEYFD